MARTKLIITLNEFSFNSNIQIQFNWNSCLCFCFRLIHHFLRYIKRLNVHPVSILSNMGIDRFFLLLRRRNYLVPSIHRRTLAYIAIHRHSIVLTSKFHAKCNDSTGFNPMQSTMDGKIKACTHYPAHIIIPIYIAVRTYKILRRRY